MTSLVKITSQVVVLLLTGPCMFPNSEVFYFDFISRSVKERETVIHAMETLNRFTSSNLTNTSIVLWNSNTTEGTEVYEHATKLWQHNAVALIEGSSTWTSACVLSQITGIPLIRIHGNKPVGQCETTVCMSADYRAYAHATVEILKKLQWNSILLLFDVDRFHEASYFKFISGIPQNDLHLLELSEQENETARNVVQRTIEQMGTTVFDVVIVYSGESYIQRFLTKVYHSVSHLLWILQGQVSFDVITHPNYKVLGFRLAEYNNSESMVYKELQAKIDSHRLNAYKINEALTFDAFLVVHHALSQVVQNYTLNTNYKSAGRSARGNMLLEHIKRANLDGLTGPIRFNEYGRRTDVQLEVLNLRNNSFVKIGSWYSSQGQAVLSTNILRNMESSYTRGHFKGVILRVVVVEEEPFVMKKKNKDGSIFYEGYCIDLLNQLANSLKFSYKIYLSPDGKYGAQTAEGEWNGMIGEVQRKKADVAIAPLTITEKREEVVDFTVAFMYYTEEMIMKKASTKKTIEYLQFLNPFDNNVWFAILGSLLVISVAVFVLNYFSPYGYKDENGRGTSEEFSLFNSVWFALACMLQQGAENQPRSLSGRILATCYWFCILIWVSTYTANLAAFLTVKRIENPIKNLEDVASSSYDVGVVHSSSTYEAFKFSKYDIYRKIWYRMKGKGSFPNTTKQGLQWTREKEDFVFISDAPILRYAANKKPCDLTTVPGLNTAHGLAFALHPHNPRTAEFTLTILRLRETNFLDQLTRKWWENTNECPQEAGSALSQKSIDLTSMLGVYVVLGGGVIAAFITLIAEVIFANFRLRGNRPIVKTVQVIPRTERTISS